MKYLLIAILLSGCTTYNITDMSDNSRTDVRISVPEVKIYPRNPDNPYKR